MSSSLRNTIRTKVLSSKGKVTQVTLDDEEGTTIEVRESSVGQMLEAVDLTDLRKRMAHLLIQCCYVPGTEEKVFEAGDFDTLMQLPSSGIYNKLMEAVNAMTLPAQVEEAGKVSEKEPISSG